MSYTRHTILTSILFFQISLANDSVPQNIDQIKHQSIGIPPSILGISKEEYDIIEEELYAQRNKSINEFEFFDKEEIEEMELVFEFSPKNAQQIVKHLQDPTYLSIPNYRAAFFIGEPGTGKTMMAKAIAYKMSQEGWEYRFRTSTSFLGECHSQTAINLQKELTSIKASNKPTILIIDELNLFLENTESKYHDTNITSNVLWDFLDEQSNNPNFFFIGTLRYSKKLSRSSIDKMNTYSHA